MEIQQKSTSPLLRYINEFLEYCEVAKNQSLNTIKAYDRYLRKFSSYAKSLGIDDPKKINLPAGKDECVLTALCCFHSIKTVNIATMASIKIYALLKDIN